MTTDLAVAWDEVAFATGPADRAAAEEGVRRAYRDAGLAEPDRIVWFDSPARGAVAAALLRDGTTARVALSRAGLGSMADQVLTEVGTASAGAPVRDAVRTAPWERARTAAHAALGPLGWSRAWAATGGRLWPPVNRIVAEIRRGIAEFGGEHAGDLLRGATLDAVLGQHEAAWLCVFDPGCDRLDSGSGTGSVGGSAVPAEVAVAERAALRGLSEVAGAAGWWWPFEKVALISERPAELHRDDLGRLHRADGPAMAFPDAFELHAWHGMPVPPDFGPTMATLSVERIRAEQNAELRRVMLEHYGYLRYLTKSGARPVHSDETGVLWRISLRDDEDIVMVEVENSTPEPDGTHRTYVLRVPPWVQRAREGVAWTFGVSEEDYRPERET